MGSRRNAKAPTTVSTARGTAPASPSPNPSAVASVVTPDVAPRLSEPYEKRKYDQLRRELSVRRIKVPRTGPERVSTRAGFIATLRAWDRLHGIGSGGQAPTKAAASRRGMSNGRVRSGGSTTGQGTAGRRGGRLVRARRGCRFRLINVLLSPAFNSRWQEMVTLKAGKAQMQVNKFWLDVHTAFMAENEIFDQLHFQDALFVNVTPHVILSHSAARLLQIWVEIVSMYRTAVNSAKQAAATAPADKPQSFFDYCAGRLDLLYLHMAMMLEPELYNFIMGDTIPVANPFGQSRGKSAAAKKDATAPAAGETTMLSSQKPAILSGVPVQNPEMSEAQVAVQVAAQATLLPPTTPQKAMDSSKKASPGKTPGKAAAKSPTASQKKPVTRTRKPATQKKPRKSTTKAGNAPDTDTIANESESKRAVLVPAKPAMAIVSATKKTSSETSKDASTSSTSNGLTASTSEDSAQTRVATKRAREEVTSTDIVELPSARKERSNVGSELVPHPAKRVHTTMSTALTTRPGTMMLPPDEWDILENRLRKVNEDIDRCHRNLAGVDMSVSEAYKQTLEADLRFFSAIKQRLQEQLLVVMQSGY